MFHQIAATRPLSNYFGETQISNIDRNHPKCLSKVFSQFHPGAMLHPENLHVQYLARLFFHNYVKW